MELKTKRKKERNKKKNKEKMTLPPCLQQSNIQQKEKKRRKNANKEKERNKKIIMRKYPYFTDFLSHTFTFFYPEQQTNEKKRMWY